MKKRPFIRILSILLGNLIYAVAVVYFILPAGLITGGTTGLAIFMQHSFGIPINLFVCAFNTAMFVLGAVVLGRAFALTTLVSTFVYPLFLSAVGVLAAYTGTLTADPMLCTVFAGVLIGAGIALVIQAGASTGGMDIPPLIIQKYTGLSMALLLYAFDGLILLLQILFSNREQVLYGILLVCIYSMVLEKLLVFGKSKVQLKIISEKYEEINSLILHTFDRGTTLLEVEGGLTRRESYAVLTVIDQRELFRINEAVWTIDPDAFVMVGQIKEVHGRGFTSSKKYEMPAAGL